MFVQNFIKLSAAVHELSCAQAFLPDLAMVANPKIRSCDLDLWPWNSLGFVRWSRNMFMQNFIELSSWVTLHTEISWKQRMYLATTQTLTTAPSSAYRNSLSTRVVP